MNDVEKKSQQIIQKALNVHASDIHFSPRKNHTEILFRIAQQLTFIEKVPKSLSEKIISHFKFRAGMDIGERRRPQNGSIEFIINNQLTSIRISTLPTTYDESLVLRLLPQEETLSLAQLPLFPKIIKQFNLLIQRRNGLILLTGPTGSGKSTTLYALLYAAKSITNRNIISIEDPVEKRTEDILQLEINEKAGLTYAEGLKSILRHDPDIIMIGEIRDLETARLAIRASLTGHLVLSTVHSKNALSCIYRMLELGIPMQDLRETLIGIVSQRLVELTCPMCGDECRGWCRKHRKQQQKAIFEILADQNLEAAFKIVHGENVPLSYKTLEDNIKKAIALGYISKHSFSQWFGDLHEK